MVQSDSGWTRGVQVKLWDPLRTRAIAERLRGAFTTRRYTNSRLPLPLPLAGLTERDILLSWTPRITFYKNRVRCFCLRKSNFASFLHPASLCKHCQRQSCKAFTGLSIYAKSFAVDVPYFVKFWPKLSKPLHNRRFPINICCSASAVTPSENVQLCRLGSPLRAFNKP